MGMLSYSACIYLPSHLALAPSHPSAHLPHSCTESPTKPRHLSCILSAHRPQPHSSIDQAICSPPHSYAALIYCMYAVPQLMQYGQQCWGSSDLAKAQVGCIMQAAGTAVWCALFCMLCMRHCAPLCVIFHIWCCTCELFVSTCQPIYGVFSLLSCCASFITLQICSTEPVAPLISCRPSHRPLQM